MAKKESNVILFCKMLPICFPSNNFGYTALEIAIALEHNFEIINAAP